MNTQDPMNGQYGHLPVQCLWCGERSASLDANNAHMVERHPAGAHDIGLVTMVMVVHEAGEFVAITEGSDEEKARDRVYIWAMDRGLDVVSVDVATQDDITEADGQYTYIDKEI